MADSLTINNRCISCDYCKIICPENAILTDGKTYFIEPWACSLCGLCINICPTECIKPQSSSD